MNTKKTILIIIILFTGSLLFAGSDSIKWQTNIEDSLKDAKASQKPLFIFFTGSDWCGWCKKLDAQILSKKDFIEYAEEDMIMVKLDFPRSLPQTEEIKKYNREQLKKFGVRGFPTILILDSKGDIKGKTGYRDLTPSKYIEHIKEFLK